MVLSGDDFRMLLVISVFFLNATMVDIVRSFQTKDIDFNAAPLDSLMFIQTGIHFFFFCKLKGGQVFLCCFCVLFFALLAVHLDSLCFLQPKLCFLFDCLQQKHANTQKKFGVFFVLWVPFFSIKLIVLFCE